MKHIQTSSRNSKKAGVQNLATLQPNSLSPESNQMQILAQRMKPPNIVASKTDTSAYED